MNTLRAAGILEGSVSQIEGISPNFDLPAILRTWAMQMSAGFPLNAMLFGKMRPGKIYPVDVLCGVMVAGAAVAALAALDASVCQNPAWQALDAVRQGRLYVLDKELFHYKPNARWGESYETLFKILYGE